MNNNLLFKKFRSIIALLFLFTFNVFSQADNTCGCPENGKFNPGSEIPDKIIDYFSPQGLVVSSDSCWDFGTEDIFPESDFHIIDRYRIYVPDSGYYYFTGTDGNKLMISIYKKTFNIYDVCENLYAGFGGYVKNNQNLIYEEPQNNGLINNKIFLKSGLYIVVLSDFDVDYLGDYFFSITSQDDYKIQFNGAVYNKNCTYFECYNDTVNYDLPTPNVPPNGSVHWTDIVDNGLDCGNIILKRHFEITDSTGVKSYCNSEFLFVGYHLIDIEWPKDWDGTPGNNDVIDGLTGNAIDLARFISPDYSGYPDGVNEFDCGVIESSYEDQISNNDSIYKIFRTWSLVDDCNGTFKQHVQNIFVNIGQDTIVPQFNTVDSINAKTKVYVCNSDVKIPLIQDLNDNSAFVPKWWVSCAVGTISGDKNNNGYVDSTEQWYLVAVPLGKYDLCYHAIDLSGNETVKCIDLNIIDETPPNPVCKQYLSVSLPDEGMAKLNARDFDDNSFDNCSDVYFKVLRINSSTIYDGGCIDLNGDDNPQTSETDVWYDDEVSFCCEDIKKDILVSLRVFDLDPGSGAVKPERMLPGRDLYGHYNDCRTVVSVESRTPPVIDCHDVTIDCGESLNPNDNPKLFPDIVSVCGYTYTYSDEKETGRCKTIINRTWEVVSNDRKTTCTQQITVGASRSFDPCTIEFPESFETYCSKDLNDLSKPVWEDNSCYNITFMILNEDTIKFTDDKYYKIIREWAVIDNCLYDSGVGAENNVDSIGGNKLDCTNLIEDGFYRYKQVIILRDSLIPDIVVEDQCIPTSDCYAEEIELQAMLLDTCLNLRYNWQYIIVNIDTGDTIQYSYNYLPIPSTGTKGDQFKDNLDNTNSAKLVISDKLSKGNYEVTWRIINDFEDTNSAQQNLDVVDNTSPIPVIADNTILNTDNGMVEISAIEFDLGDCYTGCISSLDNCTFKDDLIFTFTDKLPEIWEDTMEWNTQFQNYGLYYFDALSGKISTKEKYLNGEADAYLPQNKSSKRIVQCLNNSVKNLPGKIFVWDQFAYDDNCDQNNFGYSNLHIDVKCDFAENVFGKITDLNNNEIKDSFSMIASNSYIEYNKAISQDGTFAFGLPQGNWGITGSSDLNFNTGVTTRDAVLLFEYIFGFKNDFDNPYKIVAMDVQKDDNINAFDYFMLKNLILNKIDKTDSYSWIAIAKNYEFKNILKAYSEVYEAKKITLNLESDSIYDDNDFYAVKIGDIDLSSLQENTKYELPDIKLWISDTNVNAGQEVLLPVYANYFDGILGMQFEIELNDMYFKGFESGFLDTTKLDYNVIDNKLLLSSNLFQAEFISFDTSEVLFYLNVEATKDLKLKDNIKLSQKYLKPEVYKGLGLEIHKLDFKVEATDANVETGIAKYALLQNKPNPFSKKTEIGFITPNALDYELTLYDIEGKIIKNYTGKSQIGYNKITIINEDILQKGVIFYKLQTADFIDVKKMISVE